MGEWSFHNADTYLAAKCEAADTTWRFPPRQLRRVTQR